MARRAGFSLVELLVVLAIASAVAALTLPWMVGTLEQARFGSAVREVLSGLRKARGIALLKRRETVFYLDVEEKSYRIDGEKSRPLPEPLHLEVETAKSDLTQTGGKIRFFPDGSSTGGRITLVWGRWRREIDIDWLTGRVRLNHESGSGRLDR